MQLGKKIALARAEAGLDQADLAFAVGVEPASVSRWESGEAFPRPKRLGAIAKTLGRPIEWFTRDEAPSAPATGLVERLEALEKRATAFDAFDAVVRIRSLKPHMQKLLLALIYQDPSLAKGVTVDPSFLSVLAQAGIKPPKVSK